MNKIYQLLAISMIFMSCDDHKQPSKCNNDGLTYKLETMEDYANMEVKQAYHEQSEGKLSIIFKNYASREDDKVLEKGEVDIELHLKCISEKACPDNEFQVGVYPINSLEAVKTGAGVKPSFRTEEGNLPFYEISTEEDLGPERAVGFVEIKSIRNDIICGRVDIMDTHGKSIKGNFSSKGPNALEE